MIENKELGLQIGTPQESLWSRAVSTLKSQIASLEKELTVNKAFLEKAEEKLAAESRKSKSFFKRK